MSQLVSNVRNQQWLAMIHDQKVSGLSIREWCRNHSISENCFFYRQRKLREIAGENITQFVEIKQPEDPATSMMQSEQMNLDNERSSATIRYGKITIALDNSTSEELIGRIVRVLNAQ